jgi:hypothetical protein
MRTMINLVNPVHSKAMLVFNLTQVISIGILHRDKTRVQTPAKMFPHLKWLRWLFMGPTLGFATEQRNSFLIKFGVFFTIKTRFWQYYS